MNVAEQTRMATIKVLALFITLVVVALATLPDMAEAGKKHKKQQADRIRTSLQIGGNHANAVNTVIADFQNHNTTIKSEIKNLQQNRDQANRLRHQIAGHELGLMIASERVITALNGYNLASAHNIPAQQAQYRDDLRAAIPAKTQAQGRVNTAVAQLDALLPAATLNTIIQERQAIDQIRAQAGFVVNNAQWQQAQQVAAAPPPPANGVYGPLPALVQNQN